MKSSSKCQDCADSLNFCCAAYTCACRRPIRASSEIRVTRPETIHAMGDELSVCALTCFRFRRGIGAAVGAFAAAPQLSPAQTERRALWRSNTRNA